MGIEKHPTNQARSALRRIMHASRPLMLEIFTVRAAGCPGKATDFPAYFHAGRLSANLCALYAVGKLYSRVFACLRELALVHANVLKRINNLLRSDGLAHQLLYSLRRPFPVSVN
jgi:hypothetical protein